jgi:MFS family permease
VAIGLAMAVGTSWIKELSVDNGAKRAAMSLTAGFGVGAGLAGVLAEWGPWPHVLSYVLNAGVCLLGAVWVWNVPETRQRATAPTRLRDDLKIPSLGHRRFRYVVAPLAPWVFGAAIGCQAILPTLMAPKVGGAPMAFAALISVVTLSCGFGIQALARRIDRPDSARASQVALLLLVAGMGLATLAASILTIWAVLVAAVVLGAGYGIALVAGLSEVQRIAQPTDLAGLTAVYYALTYLGFAVPATLAYLHHYIPAVSYPWMFGFGAVAAAATLAMISRRSRRDLPSASPAPGPLASAQL